PVSMPSATAMTRTPANRRRLMIPSVSPTSRERRESWSTAIASKGAGGGEGRSEGLLKASQEPDIGTGDGSVGEFGHELGLVCVGPALDDSVLVLDGRITLVVRAVPSVERNFHPRVLSVLGR